MLSPLREALKQQALDAATEGDQTRVRAIVNLLRRHWTDEMEQCDFYAELAGRLDS